MKKKAFPRFIYITGCDGTGKSTQARLLVEALREQGIEPLHLWLRFPFFFSLPLLLYARWRKYSWYEEHQGVRHGYWDFSRSWLMRVVFPWVFWIDAVLASVPQVYLPLLFGKTIVCERYVFDMAADLSVGLGDAGFHKRMPGKAFFWLIPRGAKVIVLDLDEKTARSRRSDLGSDLFLGKRLNVFRQLAQDRSIHCESSQNSVNFVHAQIMRFIP